MGDDHTGEQLVNWLMSKNSVATCFIKDVLSMSESERRGLPYYHLGRVPCRSVSLVAIVVEATAYENRDLYTLDDGTGTVECTFRVDQDAQGDRASEKQGTLRSAQEPTKQRSSPIPVGSVVRVQGRVRAKRNSREIYGESVERCHGSRVELDHWRQVIALHEKHYFAPEKFVVPSPSAIAFGAQDVPRTPKSAAANPPLSVSTPSTHSTPSTSASLSPQKSSKHPSLPPRLRHPSRLRSRDLTENTFRIYVKHFMDNLRYLNFDSQSCDESDSDSDTNAAVIEQTPKTPTKQSRTTFDERTPRLRRRADALCTPRPPSRVKRSGFCDEGRAVLGCTLSFLLRVPELAALARRVVEAEARRRDKTKRPQSEAANADPAAGKRKGLASSTEGSTPKVKRLFSWAIRKLYQDGSIILWDGPVLSPPEPHAMLDSSMLYRSTLLDDSCRSSTTLRLGSQSADRTEDVSDPSSDEEAYASLSTPYLATQVERAIRSLTALQTRQKGEAENAFLGPAVSRRRHLPLPGPTTDDITNHLKREDDRWKRVTTWAIQEALEWLRDNDRVWCVSEDGGGRWELCS
ncbi:hypothetical protein EDB89DRAFT_1841481 [Lactarius sanguifluus]|nr:hypothetical protein EDB89DRAFT_1841481 [Lactarius sanguifluus]